MTAGQSYAAVNGAPGPASRETPQNGQPVSSIGVVVCTYKRPDDLARCLGALDAQTRVPDEVFVVVRDTDQATRQYLAARVSGAAPLRVVLVHEAGVVAARNLGLQTSSTDVVCMTDDDAAPRPDWIGRILEHFRSNSRLGALGGRDQCFSGGVPQQPSEAVVGRLLWNGKHVGNHALGCGPAREVDLLKGVNMSFRREVAAAIGFDQRLRGSGAQPCEDLGMSLAIGLRGWSVMYDPAVLVDHYEGARDEARHYAGQATADWAGFSNSVYNQVIAVWSSLSPSRRLASLIYFALVGTRTAPGLVQAVRFTPRLGARSWVRFFVAQKARLAAYRDLLLSHAQ